MTDLQISSRATGRYRFGIFEADAATGELRRQGTLIKLGTQPFQILCLLLQNPGQLLTRDQIARELWPDGTFVDFEHGINSAINRIREVLGDQAANPRFIETLSRRGYRFLAPVERIAPNDSTPTKTSTQSESYAEPELLTRILASRADLPRTSHPVVQTLFLLLQLMYLSFYVGALANLAEIQDLLSVMPHPAFLFNLLLITAGIMIPVRVFVACAALFYAPGAPHKLLRLWPFLLLLDLLWSTSPFLLLHHINFGVAFACTALLVYSPFAQRSLILMGAGQKAPAHRN